LIWSSKNKSLLSGVEAHATPSGHKKSLICG